MRLRSLPATLLVLVLIGTTIAPAVSAHEQYYSEDGAYSVVIGEQNEPVYTWKWTGLDLIVEDNSTGEPVSGVQHTVDATLIAPDGSELNYPIEEQFGEEGRYEFSEGYMLTEPGQYEMRLEGHIQGSSVNGTYDMPGPRKSRATVTFPDEGVPDVIALQQSQDDIDSRTAELQDRVDSLETKVDDLESKMENMEQSQDDGMTTAGFETIGAIVAVGIAYVLGRRQTS